MRKLLFILLFPLVALGQTITLSDADIKAYPGCIGHGCDGTSARGTNNTYFVTNLGDGTGAGTFRTALNNANTNGGYVLFQTGGRVTQLNTYYIGQGSGSKQIYVAGQTAQGDGFATYEPTQGLQRYWIQGEDITVRHFSIIGTQNVVIGDTGFAAGVPLEYVIEDIVFDHMLVAVGGDETLSTVTKNAEDSAVTGWLRDISITNTIIAEPSTTEGGTYATALYGQNQRNLSLIGNYYSNGSARVPMNNTDSNTWEYINNLVYWASSGIVMSVRQKVSLIGNYTDPGNGRSWPDYHQFAPYSLNPCSTSNCPPSGDSNYTGTEIYVSDNFDAEATRLYDSTMDPLNNGASGYIVGTRQTSSGYVPHAASAVPDSIAANVGPTPWNRHSYAQGQINDFINRDTQSGRSGVSTVPNETFNAGTPYTDTDSDGLSDAYELLQGGSSTAVNPYTRPATATISGSRTVDQSGVTNYATQGYEHMEIFLADLAGDWDNFAPAPPTTTPVTSVAVYPDIDKMLATETREIYAFISPSNATDLTGTWTTSNASIATVSPTGVTSDLTCDVTAVAVGTATITFTSTDGSFTDTYVLTVEASDTEDSIMTLGPQGYYTPTSGDADSWDDTSGFDLHGTEVGTITFTDQATFDGSSYYDLPVSQFLDYAPTVDEFTIIYREGDTAPTTSGYGIGKRGNAGDLQYGILAYGSGNFGAYILGGSTVSVDGAELNNNRLIIAVIQTGQVDIWIDGQHEIIGSTALGSQTYSGSANIGGRTDGSYLMNNGATLDIVATIPRAITTAERLAIEAEFQINGNTPIVNDAVKPFTMDNKPVYYINGVKKFLNGN